jgi:hypothetical protein
LKKERKISMKSSIIIFFSPLQYGSDKPCNWGLREWPSPSGGGARKKGDLLPSRPEEKKLLEYREDMFLTYPETNIIVAVRCKVCNEENIAQDFRGTVRETYAGSFPHISSEEECWEKFILMERIKEGEINC